MLREETLKRDRMAHQAPPSQQPRLWPPSTSRTRVSGLLQLCAWWFLEAVQVRITSDTWGSLQEVPCARPGLVKGARTSADFQVVLVLVQHTPSSSASPGCSAALWGQQLRAKLLPGAQVMGLLIRMKLNPSEGTHIESQHGLCGDVGRRGKA